MKTVPLDTRMRILSYYDAGRRTREETAKVFTVSLGFVKKLLQQRRKLGHAEPLYDRAGRKPSITEAHRDRIRKLIAKKPGVTLWMIREEARVPFSQPAIHGVLRKMGISLKKRHSAPRSRSARTCG